MRGICFAVVAAFMVFGPIAGHAESPELGQAIRDFNKYYGEGNLTKARANAMRAYKLSEVENGEFHERTGLLAYNVGRITVELNREKDAIPYLRQAVKIYEKALGKKHLDLALPISSLALAYSRSFMIREADQAYQRLLRISEQHFGRDHPQYADALILAADSRRISRRNRQAQSFLESALRIRRQAFGDASAEVAEIYVLLGRNHLEGRQYENAEDYYLSAIAAFDAAGHPNHHLADVAYQHLAYMYQETKKAGKKEDILKRMAARTEINSEPKALLTPHPDIRLSRDLLNKEIWVDVEFTVSVDGRVQDAVIVGSNFGNRFDGDVLKALEDWRFRPQVVNGRSVVTTNYKYRLRFDRLTDRRRPETGSRLKR